ncbi:MAG TPA: hypothetical protein VKV95_09005 [Terriglobia bacterium]|nr:hypothetical protein [Terriglobia bacterium]
MNRMNRVKMLGMIFALSLIALAVPSGAKADEWNRKTKMTFSGPVEVPGVGAQTLPAGTYVFKILDSSSDRHIVQIFNEEENHVFTTILAIPNYRLKPTDKTVMTFKERGEGKPEAIRAWFYPGHQWGEEFVYPKSRAIVLAKEVETPVLAMPLEAEPTVEALKTVEVEAVKPTGEEVPIAEVVQAPPVQEAAPVAAVEPDSKALPATASQLPLLGLIGVISLGAALGLSLIPKRAA